MCGRQGCTWWWEWKRGVFKEAEAVAGSEEEREDTRRTEPPGEGRAWTLSSQPVLLAHHFLTWPSVSSSPYKLRITRGCILLQGPCRELSSGQGPASGGLSAWKASLAILHLAIQSYSFFKAHLTHYILPFLQGEVSIPLIFLPRVLLGAFISITGCTVLEFLVPSIIPSIQ